MICINEFTYHCFSLKYAFTCIIQNGSSTKPDALREDICFTYIVSQTKELTAMQRPHPCFILNIWNKSVNYTQCFGLQWTIWRATLSLNIDVLYYRFQFNLMFRYLNIIHAQSNSTAQTRLSLLCIISTNTPFNIYQIK